jgi:hypothetical protein
MRPYITYIFCTPEVSETPQAFTAEIATLLDGVKSNHSFHGCGVISEEIIKDKKEDFKSIYRKISMGDFFEFCNRIRKTNKEIKEDGFVVLLTNKENTQKHFSGTDGKNIYINVKDLELYSLNQSRYPIAFQVLENIFQALCGIVYQDDKIDERLHLKSKGCINDVCRQKSKIINKLKSASICDSCLTIAKSKNISDFELDIFNDMLESIKNPAVFKISQVNNTSKAVVINESGQLLINGVNIEIDALPLSFYVFFLQQETPIHLVDLKKYYSQIADIYQKIKHKGEFRYKTSITNKNRIKKKVVSSKDYPINPEFSKIVTNINSVLSKSIDPGLTNSLHLRSDGASNYSIPVDASIVEIHKNYLLSN